MVFDSVPFCVWQQPVTALPRFKIEAANAFF